MFRHLIQHLESCNSWALITHPCQRCHIFCAEHCTAYGAIVGLTVEAASAVLKNIAMVAVVGVTLPPTNTGNHPTSTNPDVNSANSTSNKEYAQSALETLLRSHSISRLVDACRVYGASLGDRCVGNVVSVFSELVLNSSKFFAQVPFSMSTFLFVVCSKYVRFDVLHFVALLVVPVA